MRTVAYSGFYTVGYGHTIIYYVRSTMYCAAGVKCVYIGFGWVELEVRLEARIGLSMNSGFGA